MPDYTQPIESIIELERFLDSMYNIDINKVIILGTKKGVNNEFKAISSEYRDRLMIGFAPSTAEEVHSQFDFVTTKPEVIVYKSYDPETNTTLQTGQRI
jgi:hypothetical protein